MQSPLPQSPTALAGSHATPQPPQFSSLASASSQPLPGFSSQSPNGPTHAPTPHAPVAQPAMPFSIGSHVAPHAPQLSSELRLVSQPLLSSSSQSPKPGLQAWNAQV